ncbi:MAG: DNA-directed RNA polymerase subunit alpha [Elusimicrobia bacterium]|nr:DNA-directed RNA polymerase subunit alpha [Elusimicrobiota bacterium]
MPFDELVLPGSVHIDEKTATDFYARFTAEPYESGYGHTVGNALRRILLSSLKGSAVTAVRVEGALHEYSTLPGVREDLINILLNLKRLRVRMHGDGPETVLLSARKLGPVTAQDIKVPDTVEIINKDLVIAHLDHGGKLEAEIEISKGRGYATAEETGRVNRPAGFIPMDAIFSPVVKVHYDVEPARVGQKTDYDRLVLEITTDGSITPSEALEHSATLLNTALGVFLAEGDAGAEAELPAEENAAQSAGQDDKMDMSIELIELSSRAANCLKAAKIRTVRELVTRTDEELKAIKNFGTKSLDEIKAKLDEMGLSLGMKA